jgi:hypothetical protein
MEEFNKAITILAPETRKTLYRSEVRNLVTYLTKTVAETASIQKLLLSIARVEDADPFSQDGLELIGKAAPNTKDIKNDFESLKEEVLKH